MSEVEKNELAATKLELSTVQEDHSPKKGELVLREKTFLDAIEDQTRGGELVSVGELAGKTVDEARVLKKHLVPDGLLLPEVGEDGEILVDNREINELMLSYGQDEVRDVPYHEFPPTIKRKIIYSVQLVVVLLFMTGIVWAGLFSYNPRVGAMLFSVWAIIVVFVAFLRYGTYLIFKNRDYISFKGVVTNISLQGRFLSFWTGKEKTYIVTILMENNEFLSFPYEYSYGKKLFSGIKEHTPLTVYATKGTRLVPSGSGYMLETVLGVELAEGSKYAESEFGEEVTAKDFVRRTREG